ncbi:hypothetical protein EXIGLDRAFT_361938 [Exidia glandulosa HHB12029]|uniref:Uncharacterized protein n=1 Tax=Exidia glandulosa HHB12029 TaxID=1314781 RepID=A0A165L917_EXIGL|nr:hypothetical protein EXIGLDRAFT_361938 [Exidia glandulosa HHB12029]
MSHIYSSDSVPRSDPEKGASFRLDAKGDWDGIPNGDFEIVEVRQLSPWWLLSVVCAALSIVWLLLVIYVSQYFVIASVITVCVSFICWSRTP